MSILATDSQQIGTVIGFALFWGLIVLTVVNFVLHGVMLRWLRIDDPSRWDALGQPAVIWNNSIRNQLRVFRFVFGSASRQLDSSRVRMICRAIRLVVLIYLVDFLVIAGALFHSSLTHKN
jgi:hypothetical protein